MASPVLFSSSTFRGYVGTGTPDSTTYLRGDGSWQAITGIYNPASVAITGGTINNTTIGGTTAAAGTFTTLTSTGNTNLGDAAGDTTTITGTNTVFASLGARIQADFSNATLSNRAAFQSSTTNGVTVVAAIPNGTATAAALWATNSSDLSNTSIASLLCTSSETSVQAGRAGTGSNLPLAFYTNTVKRVNIHETTGDFLYVSSGGFGFGTGSGGSVTQATSKATGVTLNKTNGQITMNNAALADATTVSFTVTNSTIATTDCVIVNHDSVGTLGGYIVQANNIGAGSFQISVRNVSGGSLSEAIVLNFAIIKAVTS